MSETRTTGYSPPKFDSEIKLHLSRNESSPTLCQTQMASLQPENICRYPSMDGLQDALSDWLNLDSSRIVVTAGGDDALDRLIRLSLRSGTQVLTHTPSFEMVDIYTRHYGGSVVKTEWQSGAFPVADFISGLHKDTALCIVVSPNNPTGLTLPAETILEIADACQSHGCQLLVDLAYVEFANHDPTEAFKAHPQILMLRTFSKAWGMAGLRTGYLIAPSAEQAQQIRDASGPFPVAHPSLELAERAVRENQPQMLNNITQTRHFRDQFLETLSANKIEVLPSEGNFVLLSHQRAEEIWSSLGQQGVGVRKFPDSPLLKDKLRVTIPNNAADYLHLVKAMAAAMPGFEWDPNQAAAYPDSTRVASDVTPSQNRTAKVSRKTKETEIEIELNLDGTGQVVVETGIGFLDHMLTAFAFHSRFDLRLSCKGDLHIDDHHTAEDCALALGAAIDQAIGPRTGIVRFGFAYAPLDEALARTVLDLSGRPWPGIELNLRREMVGTIATENLTHVFISLAMALKCSLHVDVLKGDNDHHKAEAAFKSMALAFREALQQTTGSVPSTKGVL